MAKPEFETIVPDCPATVADDWKQGVKYCVHVVLDELVGDEISVTAPSLPGVASQGSDEREALANIQEALAGAIEEYAASGEEIPWVEEPPDVRAGRSRWVWIDAG